MLNVGQIAIRITLQLCFGILQNVLYAQSEKKTGMSTKSIHPADWFAGGAVGYFDEPGVRGGAVD